MGEESSAWSVMIRPTCNIVGNSTDFDSNRDNTPDPK